MKYSNEISCQGNDIDYRFKGIFPLFAFKALINPMNWRNRWLVVPILFVLPRRHHLMKKRYFGCAFQWAHTGGGWLLILCCCKFVPCKCCVAVSLSPESVKRESNVDPKNYMTVR